MKTRHGYRLEALTVLDLIGKDAAAILHNLTTNDVRSLAAHRGCETFITDVRGKTLLHGAAYRTEQGYRLIAPGGYFDAIASHCDRYTIREDATPTPPPTPITALALCPAAAAALDASSHHADPAPPSPPATGQLATGQLATGQLANGQLANGRLAWRPLAVAGLDAALYDCHWLGAGGGVLLVCCADDDPVAAGLLADHLRDRDIRIGDETEFHRHRVHAAYPWYGIDLDATNLPQEADRDALAISFHKGCYLGQETVARLDALGQVQRKLVRWSIDGTAAAGESLFAGDKQVARLTSVADRDDAWCGDEAPGRWGEGGMVALGYARRSHFEPGSVAAGAQGKGLTARVV